MKDCLKYLRIQNIGDILLLMLVSIILLILEGIDLPKSYKTILQQLCKLTSVSIREISSTKRGKVTFLEDLLCWIFYINTSFNIHNYPVG